MDEGISNGNVDVGIGVIVGVTVAVGSGVNVGGIGEGVNVRGTDVGGGVEAGAHPLNKIIRNTNERKTDPIDFFMTFSPFDLIVQRSRRTDCVTCAVSRQARQPGRGRRSRPTGKMIRRRKLLEMCAESPASGAPGKIARDHFIREKPASNCKSILRSGKHASRTKQWRALYMTPEVHRGFRSN